MKRLVFMALGTTAASLSVAQIYTNGVWSTGANSASGVPAPAGTTWSEVSDGNTSAGATVVNLGGATTNFRLADDFTVPTGQTWNITSVVVNAYQTGSTPTLSPFNGGRLQIWGGGAPNGGGSVIFGDTTTNVLASSTFSNLYRIFSSVNTMGGTPTAPGTTRPIYNNTLTAVISLGPGTYWIDYQLSTTNAATAFAPGVVPPGTPPGRSDPSYNALQFNGTAWTGILDTGNPGTLPDLPIDQQWAINGTIVPEPATLAVLGLGAAALLRRRKK